MNDSEIVTTKDERKSTKKSVKQHNGLVSTRDDRDLKEPLSRSLRSFARTAHSTYSLRSTLLARSIHGLSYSFLSLPCGTLKFKHMLSCCERNQQEKNMFVVVRRNTPKEDATQGVSLVKMKNAFVLVKRDNSVNTYSRISTVPQGSERSE